MTENRYFGVSLNRIYEVGFENWCRGNPYRSAMLDHYSRSVSFWEGRMMVGSAELHVTAEGEYVTATNVAEWVIKTYLKGVE